MGQDLKEVGSARYWSQLWRFFTLVLIFQYSHALPILHAWLSVALQLQSKIDEEAGLNCTANIDPWFACLWTNWWSQIGVLYRMLPAFNAVFMCWRNVLGLAQYLRISCVSKLECNECSIDPFSKSLDPYIAVDRRFQMHCPVCPKL